MVTLQNIVRAVSCTSAMVFISTDTLVPVLVLVDSAYVHVPVVILGDINSGSFFMSPMAAKGKPQLATVQ